ncbi:MAG: PD-(D/E)XK nuclease family protein [Elusimicrobia bacterium]|nr:PD-(D/E)XK nuclease family protein [Elusimicrobiota bacterium]
MKDTSFKISYSRMNSYLFCPNKYKIIYVDCKYIPLNGDMAFGNSIHKTLDHFYKHGVYSYDALMDSLNVSWESGGFDNAQEVYSYYIRALEVLKNFWETFGKHIPKKISTEHNFSATIGKYPFIGIIDRIDEYKDGTKELVDYKTHKNIWPQERVDNDLQLSLYCYACKIALGFIPDRIAIYFLSHNKKIYTTRTEEQIQKAIELCMDVADKINNNDFTPNTKNCQWCDFKETCRYNSQRTKEPDEFKVTIADRISDNNL